MQPATIPRRQIGVAPRFTVVFEESCARVVRMADWVTVETVCFTADRMRRAAYNIASEIAEALNSTFADPGPVLPLPAPRVFTSFLGAHNYAARAGGTVRRTGYWTWAVE
jgi:hypothetical protein